MADKGESTGVPELVAYRLGVKAGLLLAWEARPGDPASWSIGGDRRLVDTWLDRVDAGEFDRAADRKGL